MSLTIGDAAALSKTITEADVLLYSAVSMDTNPVHLDAEAARESPFGARIAHGMLSAGLISAVLGTRLPGPGTVYLEQSLQFRRPVFLGDTITARVTVSGFDERGRAQLETVCSNQDDEVVIRGNALVIPPGGATS